MPAYTRATLLLFLLAFGFGCGAGTFGTAPLPSPVATTPTPTNPSEAPVYYHAYGDSITVGYGLVSPTTAGYPYLLSQAENLALSDNAISGDQACDVPTRQVFPNADNPTTAVPSLYTLLISTNDADVKGSGPYESVFNLCHQAVLAWLGTPTESKIAASAAVVSGPAHVDPFQNFNSVTTDALGSSLTFSFSRSSAGPVYLWYRIVDGNPGAFSYALDGQSSGTLSTGTFPLISTYNLTTTSLALLRIPAVPAGSHSLTLTQTTAGYGGSGFVGMAVPPAVRAAGSPRVLVGTTPLQLAGNSPCGITPSICLAYVADITANVHLLAGDGLDIELFDSRKYMTGTTADLVDQLHPNPLGHKEIVHAITDLY